MKFSHSSVYMLLFIALVSPLPDVQNTIRAPLTCSTLTRHRVTSVKYRTVKFNLYACSPKPLRAGCRFITTQFFSLSLPQGLGGCTCPAVTPWPLLPAKCWPGWLGAHGQEEQQGDKSSCRCHLYPSRPVLSSHTVVSAWSPSQAGSRHRGIWAQADPNGKSTGVTPRPSLEI